MNRHVEQFWRHVPAITGTSFGPAAVLQATIDTTFALHRAGEPFRRLKAGLRVYEPFEAHHLDWYCDETGAGASIYSESCSPLISHWNNKEELNTHRSAALVYSSFYAVRKTAGEVLEIYMEPLSGSAQEEPTLSSEASDSGRNSLAPFTSAAAAERREMMARTEGLRAARVSDIARWSQPAYHDASWGARGVALARLIQPGEKVFEFGAGRSAVPGALPPDAGIPEATSLRSPQA